MGWHHHPPPPHVFPEKTNTISRESKNLRSKYCQVNCRHPVFQWRIRHLIVVVKLISEFWTKRPTTWLLLRWFLWAFFSVVVVSNFMNLPESIINYKTSIRGFLKVKSPRELMKSHERKCICEIYWIVDFANFILKNSRDFSGGEKKNWWKKTDAFFRW